MHSNLIRHTVVLICLLFGLQVNGQTPKVNITIDNPVGYKSDNVSYGVIGAVLSVGLEIDGKSVDDFTLLINEAEVKDKKYIFQQRGSYQIKAKATYNKSEVVSNSVSVTIYDSISVSYKGDWENDSEKKIIWNDCPCQLELSAQKDDSCQVSYTWEVDGSTTDSNNWKSPSNGLLPDGENDIEKNIICSIQYLTPDKSAVLKEWKKSFTYCIYRKPEPADFKIQPKVAGKVKSRDNAYYLCQSYSPEWNSITLSINNPKEYKSDKISYSWKKNDNDYSTTPEVEHAPYLGEINDGQNIDKYKLELSYCPAAELEAFKGEYEFDIVTYPNPTVSVLYKIEDKDPVQLQDRLIVWDDTKIEFPINASGGRKDGWKCSWTVDGEKYDDMSSYADGFTIGEEKTNKKIQVSLHVQNIAPDDSVLYEWPQEFFVDAWKRPDLTSTHIIRNVGGNSDNSDTIYLYKGYVPGAYGERSFEIPDLGYEESLWEYRWTDGNSIILEKKYYSPDAGDNAGSRDVSVEVSYKPEGLLVDGFSKQYNVHVRTFEKPVFEVEEWKTDKSFSVWEDTKILLSAKTEGCYTENWSYSWDKGDDTPSNKYSTVINVDVDDRPYTDHEIVLAVENKDPDGELWFKGNDTAVYRSYRRPQFEQIHGDIIKGDTIKVYQDADTTISILQVVDDPKYDYPQIKWDIDDNNLEIKTPNVSKADAISIQNDTVAFKPRLSEPVLGLHDTLSVSYKLIVKFRPDTVMADSLTHEETILFVTKYWPEPQFVIHASDFTKIDKDAIISKPDGYEFKAWIEVSDCIGDDSLSWRYSWEDDSTDENNVIADKAYNNIFNNDGTKYRDISITVKVENELSHKNKEYKDSLHFLVRINPQFNTVDEDILLLPSKEMNEHYFYNALSIKENGKFIYYTMDGIEGIKFPIVHSGNKIINKCGIDEIIDGDIVLLDSNRFHLNADKDTIVVFQPNVENVLSGQDSAIVRYRISYELEDTLRDTILYGTFDPECEFRIYKKPSIGHSEEWNQDDIYVVWDDTPITTGTVKESESTGIWGYEWFRKNDDSLSTRIDTLTDDLSMVKLNLNDENNKSNVELQLVATCYAPGGNIKWYKDTLSRKFAVWRKPERRVRQYQIQNENDILPIKSGNDTLNVCVLYSGSQDISLSFDARYSDPIISWTDNVYWGDSLKNCFEEIDRDKGSYEYARYKFDRFDVISESFTDSIRYVSKAIPTYTDEKYKLLCDTVSYTSTLYTRIWPIQKYELKNKDDFSWNDGDTIIIQAETSPSGKNEQKNPLDSMSFITSGGLETSRGSDYVKYYWSKDKDGDYKELKKGEIYSIINDKKEYVDSTYYVKCVQSGYDSLNWCKDSIIQYNVRCYPVINVPVTIDGLGDVVKDLIEGDAVVFRRPYDDYEKIGGEWTYRNSLILDEDTLHKDDNSKFSFKIERDDKYRKDSLEISSIVECKVENGIQLSVTDYVYKGKIKVWPFDSVSLPEEFANNNTIIIHKGLEKETELYCKHETDDNEIDKFWEYKWSYKCKCDDDNVIAVDINNDIITADSERNIEVGSYVDVDYFLNAKYQPGKAKERDYRLVYHVREYSEPLIPSICKNDTTQYRENDTYRIIFNNEDWKRSGNWDGWEIEWNLKKIIYNGNTVTTEATLDTKDSITWETALPDIEKDEKCYYECQYSVTLSNYHPNNNKNKWKDIVLYDTVFVYNRPPKPNTLTIKGNGKSGIYIAIFEDNKEAPKDVEYEFGQEDSICKTILPFTRFAPDSQQNTWVRTYWEYEDKYICYSDPVFYKPGNNGTKAAIGELNVDYMHFAASLENPNVATVRIMNSSGQVVQIISYDADTDFDEYIDLDGLKQGMYIVIVEVGGLVETKKTLIR